ncbi:GIY-YIG nuclease family protein [Romboutsia maritimum]|uniref:GIY-YIG nuclease family protein n=1 Tax=Romboutsia maritimum TaxID=2020948 RepID=UPI0018F2A103|nr:hypothetical protein [Romboutsia maritimum]
MKNNFQLSNFKTEWIKYSEYELKNDNDGNTYIIPAKNSTYTIYNPFEVSDKLLFDLIELGDEALKEYINKELILEKIILFAKNYGLLGLVSSNVYNRNIVGEETVLFTENSILTKEKLMDAKDYINLFLPFTQEEDIYTRNFDEHLTIFKAEDSPKFYGKRPLILDVVFSKFYSEQINWILEFSKMISNHVNQLLIYRDVNLTEPVTIMAGKFKAQKISFTISMFEKTEINWEFDSLQSIIETIYAFVVTNEKFIVNRCEYCNKVFIAKSEREKYCSPSCRNCTNVIKSRNKKKLIKDNKSVEDVSFSQEKCNKSRGEDIMKLNKKGKRKEAMYEYKERTTTGGVYKITNTVNNKNLIRSEIDLRGMKNRFNFSMSTNSCINPKMQKDWNEFGSKVYVFEVLEEIEMKDDITILEFKKQLKDLEDKYISQFDDKDLY